MKQIILKVKDETHKAARIKALMLDKSLMQYVIDLMEKDLGNKKSNHAEFGDLRDCSKT